MDDFEEIGHSGGKIEFIHDEKGLSIRFSGCNPWAMKMYQLKFSLDGSILKINSFRETDDDKITDNFYIPCFIISDRNGFFGRSCSVCNSYFRTDSINTQFCPYCGCSSPFISFHTKNQLQYIEAFCNAFLKASIDKNDIIIDLDEIADSLENNKSPWTYKKEKQQTQITCSGCNTIYDILGEYGMCPDCRKYNGNQVISSKIDTIENQFNYAKENMSERKDREDEWIKVLYKCVSEFEGLSKNICSHLLKFQMISNRRTELQNINFQNIMNANEIINRIFGFEILKDFTEIDKNFINIIFNKRHIFTHNNGIVDLEYLRKTKDNSVREKQLVRLRSREIARLIQLIRKACSNFVEGYEGVK